MKKTVRILLILLPFLSTVSCAQKTDKTPIQNSYHSEIIKDSIFENVIEITDQNVESNGIDYLFNVPISKKTDTLILFLSAKVPSTLLPTIYPNFSKLIVIVPNWNYYLQVSANLPKDVICAEPMTSSIVYEFNRANGKLQKDSLVLMGRFPKMKFKEVDQLKDNERAIYYVENYGSACCPKDQQWDNKPSREEFISFFEKENKVKITNSYRRILGKEGEANYYYTLIGLSNKMKLKFIVERDFYRILNRQNKDLSKQPKIYTPFVLAIDAKTKNI